MAGNIANLFVVLGAKTEGFQKGLKDAEKAAVKASRSFERSFGPALNAITSGLKIMGGAAAVGFGALVGSGIKANSQMEQYRNTLETVMGDSQKAAETLDWVKQYAAKTPFEIPGLVESTVKLQAMGMEAQKFIPVAADMAAVFASSGKTVQDAAEALSDAAMGEFERLKEFGIKLRAEDFKAGGKYAGVAYADAVMQEVKNHNYTGAAEGLSNTFTGRLSTLKDTLGQVLQNATAPVFEKISISMGNLMAKIEEWSASGALQVFTDKLTAGMMAAWGVMEKVAGVVVSIAKGIADNWGVIGPILAGVGAAFVALQAIAAAMEIRIIALKVAQLAWNIAMGANPIGAIVLAIAALVAAGVVLYQNLDTIKAKAGELWTAIETAWNNAKIKTEEIWGAIETFVDTTWNNLITWGTIKWQGFQKMFLDVWEAIKIGLKGYVNSIIGMINAIIDALNTIQVEIPDWVPELGGLTFGINLPKVPMLAKGGIVTSPTLAMIGERGPEAVIPLNNILSVLSSPVVNVATPAVAMAAPSAAGPVTINVYGNNADEILGKLKRDLVRAGVKLFG
ncbi:MAG: tape measure protein [Firmicutes bacterium]|nr:tape measure protein [Bacillota bacterium]